MMAAQREHEVRKVTLASLLRDLAPVPSALERQIAAVTLDSRAVTPGSLFMALPGTRTHGAQFVRDAARNGAVAILHTGEIEPGVGQELQNADVALIVVDDLPAVAGVIASRFYAAPTDKLRLVGVTGTDGKTSVSHLLAQALDSEPAHCGLLGTLGAGRVDDLQAFGLTTPDAVTLQARLAAFVDAGFGHVVMEVSSHALAQHRVAGCRFALAVLTNLGRDHLDYHGDLQAYAQAKSRLFEMPALDAAVLNLDDPFSATIHANMPRTVRAFGYSRAQAQLGGVKTLRAARAEATVDGIVIELAAPFAGQRLSAPLLGEFNASNVLAVAAALLALDWAMPRIAAVLADSRAIPGRMELVSTAARARVIVDYSHTPQSLQRALQALRPLTAGKLICVFGCGGDRDRGKRPLMGAIAEKYADIAIVTDDNPRDEDPQIIVNDIVAGMQRPSGAQIRQPREAAIREALRQSAAGDCVLIAGKGHEPYQLIGGQHLAFDDRLVARQLAKELAS